MTTDTPLDHLCATIRGIAATEKSPLDVGAQVETLVRATVPLLLSRPAPPTSKADELLERLVETVERHNPRMLNEHEWNLKSDVLVARALTAARAHVEKNRADAPTVPGFDSQSAQPVQREGASAPSSREVVCRDCEYPASAHNGEGTWTDEPICLRTRAEVEAQGKASGTYYFGDMSTLGDAKPNVVKLTASPPTTGERDIPSWVPSDIEITSAVNEHRRRRAATYGTSFPLLMLHTGDGDAIRCLIAQRAPLSPEAKLTRVKVNRQYSAHGVRIVEVMSDASQRHVDSIYWGELLEEKRRFSPEAKGEGTVDVEKLAKTLCAAFRGKVESAPGWDELDSDVRDGYVAEARCAIELLTGGAK